MQLQNDNNVMGNCLAKQIQSNNCLIVETIVKKLNSDCYQNVYHNQYISCLYWLQLEGVSTCLLVKKYKTKFFSGQ